MDAPHIAAALLSALLHASWNAAVKASRNPPAAMTMQMVIGAGLALPGLLWSGLPDRAAWVWVAASTLTNVLTISALLRAYVLGGFGIVYPMARALSVMLVVPLSGWLAAEHVGSSALLGIAAVVVSLALLAADATRHRTLPLAALGWTLLAGLGTAAYVIFDAQGVRASGSSLAYGLAVSVANAAAMSAWHGRAGASWSQFQKHWAVGLPTAIAAMVSYLLILWVWSGAPIAPASALRDTSAIFALLIAIVWLKEPFTLLRIVAVVVAAAAVPLLRLG
jgi:drug/metabolite transporter (DMT)-like permease